MIEMWAKKHILSDPAEQGQTPWTDYFLEKTKQ